MKIIRRVIGVILLLGAVIGLALSVAGTIYGRMAVDLAGVGVDNTLVLASESLVNVVNTLTLVKTSIADVNNSLDTVEVTARDLAVTVSDTRPLLDKVNQVATNDVPTSLEAVQEAMPNIVEVAGVIDQTLLTLSNFNFNQSIVVPNPLGFNRDPLIEIPIDFGLGIEYEPTVPFDDAVGQVAGSLEGLPAQLRTLEADLVATSANLETISNDINNVSDDLVVINDRIAEVAPLMDEYIRIVNQINDTLGQARQQIKAQLDTIKMVVLIIMIWIGLGNLAPLYLGLELVLGRRDPKPEADKS